MCVCAGDLILVSDPGTGSGECAAGIHGGLQTSAGEDLRVQLCKCKEVLSSRDVCLPVFAHREGLSENLLLGPFCQQHPPIL